MKTWATLTAKHAALTSGMGLSAIPAMGWQSVDGFAAGVLLAGAGFAALNSSRRLRSCPLPPAVPGGASKTQSSALASGRLARVRQRVDGLLTGMLSDDLDFVSSAPVSWRGGADIAPAARGRRDKPPQPERVFADRAAAAGLAVSADLDGAADPDSWADTDAPADPDTSAGTGAPVSATSTHASRPAEPGELARADVPLGTISTDVRRPDTPGELAGADEPVTTNSTDAGRSDGPGEGAGPSDRQHPGAAPAISEGGPRHAPDPAGWPYPDADDGTAATVSRFLAEDEPDLGSQSVPEPEPADESEPPRDTATELRSGPERDRPSPRDLMADERFWGPRLAPGGYRSRHRSLGPAGNAKPRDGRRPTPRHAAPPTRFGVALGRTLSGAKLTSRSAAHAAG